MRRKKITIVGQTNWDYETKPGVVITPGNHIIDLLYNGWQERIALDANAIPGAKINATEEVPFERISRFFLSPRPAGGALNLAVAIQETTLNWPVRPIIRLVDTNKDNGLVPELCKSLDIELVTLPRHGCLHNYVLLSQGDKNIIRTGRIQLPDGISDEIVERVRAVAQDTDILILVSPKDAQLSNLIWREASQSIRYINTTNSIPWLQTSKLTPDADGLISNFFELRQFARAMGNYLPEVDENSLMAPQLSVDTLLDMKQSGYLSNGVAAVTLGRNGSVLVDLDKSKAWKLTIRLRAGCRSATTRSGCGDRWLGNFILNREFANNGQGKEHTPLIIAATFASQNVAEFLGLHSHDFIPEVEAIDMSANCHPVRRISPPINWPSNPSIIGLCQGDSVSL